MIGSDMWYEQEDAIFPPRVAILLEGSIVQVGNRCYVKNDRWSNARAVTNSLEQAFLIAGF